MNVGGKAMGQRGRQVRGAQDMLGQGLTAAGNPLRGVAGSPETTTPANAGAGVSIGRAPVSSRASCLGMIQARHAVLRAAPHAVTRP
jgi:hypothetical protein